MNRYVSVAMMLGLAWGAAGCSDVLTTVPQDRISDQVFWKTEADYTLAVNAVYNRLNSSDVSYLDNATDIGYNQQYFTAAGNGLWARGTEVATSGYPAGFWNRFYQGISRANDVMDHLAAGSGTLTDAAKAKIEGQARFLRGVFYHELLWMFGDVPINTHVLTIDEGKEAKRATRDEVYNQAKADLQAAADKLPTSWSGADKGRATKGAALAYLTRLALYEASYQKYALNNATKSATLYQDAVNYANQVVALNAYSLYANFRNLFTYAGEGNAEVILDYQRVKGGNGWSSFRYFAPVSLGGTVEATTPTRAVVDMFYMKDGLCPKQDPTTRQGCPLAQSPLYVDDPVQMYQNRDPRFYATVLYPMAVFEGSTYNSFPTSTTSDKLDRGNFYNTHTGYLYLKYVDISDRSDNQNSGINNILMRYAEVLLNLAEAKAELNQFDQATADATINKLRQRATMPNVTVGTQAQNIALIRNERAVEFANEGLRMADIRRWRTAKTVMPGRVFGISYLQGTTMVTASSDDTRLFTDREYLFPIPQTEINLAKNLTQNPGF